MGVVGWWVWGVLAVLAVVVGVLLSVGDSGENSSTASPYDVNASGIGLIIGMILAVIVMIVGIVTAWISPFTSPWYAPGFFVLCPVATWALSSMAFWRAEQIRVGRFSECTPQTKKDSSGYG